jgi:hypothetical protein
VSGYRVLAAAASCFEELRSALDADTRQRLTACLERLRELPDGGPAHRRAADEAARLVAPWLPPGPAADTASRFTADSGSDSGPASSSGTGHRQATHHGFTAEDLAVLVLDGHGMAGPVLGPVRDRLLAAPALDAAEVSARGGDAWHPDLIRLRAPGGRERLPAFQFAADGHPLPVVLTVNQLLDAARDPWGTTDWWLSPNAWLGGPPAALLGTAREPMTADAARELADAAREG